MSLIVLDYIWKIYKGTKIILYFLNFTKQGSQSNRRHPFYLKDLLILTFYMYEYFVPLWPFAFVYTQCRHQRPEEGSPRSPRVVGGCESLWGRWELNLGLPQEQTVLLTTKPSSLQPPDHSFFYHNVVKMDILKLLTAVSDGTEN